MEQFEKMTLDYIDTTDLQLMWNIEKVPFDKKTDTFRSYLEKEEKKFNKPSLTNKRKAIVVSFIGALIISFLLLIPALVLLVELINNTYSPLDSGYLSQLNVPSDFQGLINLYFLIMISFTLMALSVMGIYQFLYTLENWSEYHDRFLTSIIQLEKVDALTDILNFNSETNQFQIVKVPATSDLEWLYPLLFNSIPPLLLDISGIILFGTMTFFLMPVILLPPLFLGKIIYTLILCLIGLFPLIMLLFGGLAVIHQWKTYYLLRKRMLRYYNNRIFELSIQKIDDTRIIGAQSQLNRILSFPIFPLPQIFKIFTIFPMVGSILTFILGLIII